MKRGKVIFFYTSVAPSRVRLGSGLEIMVDGRQVHTLTGHSDIVFVVAFSPNGNRVVSGAHENLVKIWDTATGTLVSSVVGVR